MVRLYITGLLCPFLSTFRGIDMRYEKLHRYLDSFPPPITINSARHLNFLSCSFMCYSYRVAIPVVRWSRKMALNIPHLSSYHPGRHNGTGYSVLPRKIHGLKLDTDTKLILSLCISVQRDIFQVDERITHMFLGIKCITTHVFDTHDACSLNNQRFCVGKVKGVFEQAYFKMYFLCVLQ